MDQTVFRAILTCATLISAKLATAQDSTRGQFTQSDSLKVYNRFRFYRDFVTQTPEVDWLTTK